MFICNHVIAGAAIGLVLEDHPFAAFVAGVGSHFALDMVPHWASHDKPKDDGSYSDEFVRAAKIDGCLGCALIGTLLLAAPSKPAVAAGIAGACLPDLDKPAQYFFGKVPFPAWWQELHRKANNQRPGLAPREMVIGAVGMTAVMVAMSRRRRRQR